MKAVTFLSLVTLGATASLPVSLYPEAKLDDRQVPAVGKNHTCKIVAQTPGQKSVNCYYCDDIANPDCSVVKKLPVNALFTFDCLCPKGGSVNGITAWDHLPDYYCWVPANTTDENCPTQGSSALMECAFCSK